jgi:hypothetical protein
MGIKRLVVLIAIMSLLLIGTASPTPARADAAEIAIFTTVAVVGYAALVFIGTALTRRTLLAWTEAPGDLQVDRKQPPAAVRLGPKCRQSSAELTLLCW